MVAPAFKRVFLTSYEAIRDFLVATIFYLAVIFSREVCALGTSKSPSEILTIRSYLLLLTYGSLIYFGFLTFWGISVYKSVKHYRKKQRDLQMLLAEQEQNEE